MTKMWETTGGPRCQPRAARSCSIIARSRASVRLTAVMRAASRGQTGNIGETEVTAKFERLGWGVAPNPRHDVGTDLWLMARDARLFDLGLVVGAQVKGGPSWFAEEHHDKSGVVDGWWFRDRDGEHVDAWLAHRLPHLIVLHDLHAQVSYWVHVVKDVVERTGKGAKILVPAVNTIDEEHRDDLLRVAAATTPGGAWEGSAWTGAATVPSSSLLRHALVVPRLIAPHPNADNPAVAPAQAVALLVQARLRDLQEEHDQHEDLPTIEQAVQSQDWDWRFVGALGRRVTTDEHELLVAAIKDAPDPARRAAATVAAAATLLEEGLADDSLALLDAALELDDADPVDHAWLSVQKARACQEIGRRDEARAIAAEVQAISVTHRDDLTATALAGVAASMLFDFSDWGVRDLASAIAGADTTATWWRAQTTSRGLTALTERTFNTWARDTTVRFSVSDVANNQLFSAALTASFLGDHGSWRNLASLLGCDGLLRTERDTDPDIVSAALDLLRVAGSVDDVKHAVRRLLEDGPATAVTSAAARVNLDRSTRTTAAADLALLEYGGDLLDTATADRTARWLLRAVQDPAAFVDRTSPTYVVGHRLIETLACVVPAASQEVRQLVVAQVTTLTPQTDQMLATSWAAVVTALPGDDWTKGSAAQAAAAASDHHAALETPLLELGARYDENTRQRLLQAAGAGSLDALAALGDVRGLPSNVVTTLIASLVGNVEAQVKDAHNGAFGMGGHDVAGTLVLLNLWHPTLATWEPVIQLIQDNLVLGEHKHGALRRLTQFPDQVPDEQRAGLLTAASQAARQSPLTRLGLLPASRDATGMAAEVLTLLSNDDAAANARTVVTLLGGDENSRRSAARIAGRRRRDDDIGVLLVLVHDVHPAVRATAAFHLAKMVVDGTGGDGPILGLQQAVRDKGRRVPLHIAHVVAEADASLADVEQMVDDLRRHPSAAVRRTAGGTW